MSKIRILFVGITIAYVFIIVVHHLTYTNNVEFERQPEDTTFLIEDNNSDSPASTSASINVCAERPESLKGRLHFDIQKLPPSIKNSELQGGNVKFGGTWTPEDCVPIKKVAILVPYRKRPEQLEVFLSHMHPIFQRQKLDYRVFVIEQTGDARFNKGAIYNIGFNATLSYDDYDCYIFHDVDLLCEHDHNFYGCPQSPMHMSPAIDKFKYKLSYPTLVGGIQAIAKDHYFMLNGYSNSFWGWGGEDDNLYTRFVAKGLKLKRPPMNVARYKMNQIHHFRSDGWSQTNRILLTRRKPRQDSDGLNSLQKLNYTVKEYLMPLYTLISVNLHE